MLRLFAPGIGGLIFFCVWAFAVFDVIATDEMLIRNLPSKLAWLFVVIFIPLVGPLAWFALGRPVGAGLTPGATRTNPNRSWQQERGYDRPAPPRGPEDRADWRGPSTNAGDRGENAAARERRLQEWEAELQRREKELDDPDAQT